MGHRTVGPRCLYLMWYNGDMYKLCHMGHERSPDNVLPDGHCRLCDKARKRNATQYQRDARNQYNQRWYRNGGAGVKRAGYLLRTYKMTGQEYDEQLERQGGGCAICGKTAEDHGYNLSVDHDHACCPGSTSCGKCRRGILCSACNSRVEWLIDHHATIMEYLATWS